MGQYYKGVILPKDYRENVQAVAEVAETAWDWQNGAKLMEHSYINNEYVQMYVSLLANQFNGYPFVWCGDYADDIRCHIEGKTQSVIDEEYEDELIPYTFKPKTKVKGVPTVNIRYVYNYDTKEYVDLETVEGDIHPLPLLTCSGNGRGGGDYWGQDNKNVGRWAYNHIGAGNEIPEGFTELKTKFKEED